MGDTHNLWNNSGYTVNNPSAWAPPVLPSNPQNSRYETRAVKRSVSESEDCDDVFSEESSKDRCSSPNEDCQMGFSRKKRRGIIEKRRRDRINSSLSELRRLVPTAFEKQGSAKLEKAEILQMTVDHLKTLHAKGIDALAYDPHKFAMDYHSIGFRECAAEVARYLVTVEGMDIQDPLRLRLMSHLQCFAAQRELATKQASTSWNYNTYGGFHDYPPSNSYEITPSSQQHQSSMPSHTASSSHSSIQPPNRLTNMAPSVESRLPVQPNDIRHHSSDNLNPERHVQHGEGAGQIPYSSHHTYQSGFTQQNYNNSGQGVKPYRPWGAEVAY